MTPAMQKYLEEQAERARRMAEEHPSATQYYLNLAAYYDLEAAKIREDS